MAPSKQRCTCQVYGCAKASDLDPRTHIPTPGHLLSPSTHHQHRRDDKIWRSAQRGGSEDVEMDVLEAITRPDIDYDPVVLSRVSRSEAGNRCTLVSAVEPTVTGIPLKFGTLSHI